MSKIIPSKYQANIFDFLQNGKGNALINATAGSGKSTTLINCLELIPITKKVLFLAFNNSIVEELKSRVKQDNVEIRTLHSLGYSFIKDYLGVNKIGINDRKYKQYINENFDDLIGDAIFFKSKTEVLQYKDNLNSLINLARFYLCETSKELVDIAIKHSINVMSNECDVCLEVIKWGVENLEEIDFTDMIYIPNILNIKPKKYTYDYVFIDECFPYNQRVITDEGKIKIGTLYNRFIKNKKLPLIKSFNDITKEYEFKKILNVWNRGERELVEVIIDGERKIKCTPNERFLTLNGYEYISDLKEGDCLYGGMSITSIKILSKKEIVYDIEVEDNHNFIITSNSWNTNDEIKNEGFIVHNCQDLSIAQRELFLKTFKKKTRFIAVGDEKQCQPFGTKILMSDGITKNIEEIEIGDGVVSYSGGTKNEFYGYYPNKKSFERYDKYSAKILDVKIREDFIQLYTIKAGDYVSKYTHEHKCMAKFNKDSLNSYILYMMQKGDQYRIGIHPLWTNSGRDFSLSQRARNEGADKAWILNIYDNRREAYENEQIISYVYGIPQLRFYENTKNNQQKSIDYMWGKIIEKFSLFEKAFNVLQLFNKDIELPIWEKVNKNYISKNSFRSYHTCNLFPKYMDVGVFDTSYFTNKRRKIKPIAIESINIEHKIDKVVSLKVSNDEMYVADNILTHNCIYGFMGADEHSFKELSKIPNTVILPLSISYRCPINVIKLAQTLVPSIEHRDNAPLGSVEYNLKLDVLEDGDMVLCRCTKPLVTLYMKLLEMKRAAYIKGKDIAQNMIKLIEDVDSPILNVNLSEDGVFIRLYKDLINRRNKLMLLKGIDEEEATIEAQIVNLYDTIKSLEILSKDLIFSHELIKRINSVFNENIKGIMLSTIHKSKGLESDNVYILCKSLLPSPLATKEWEKNQEKNLEYVAYTRAKQKLGFISEQEIGKDSAMVSGMAMYNELRHLSSVINYTLNLKNNLLITPIQKANDSVIKLNDKKSGVKKQPKSIGKTSKNITDEITSEYNRKLNRFNTIMNGKSVKECYEMFNDLGITNVIRPIKNNGEYLIITSDFKDDRINVIIENNLIINIENFG